MNNAITYLIYLAVSIAITVSIGHKLRRNGLLFLNNHLRGNSNLAFAINNMLLIGFYLVNIGYILLVLNLNSSEVLSELRLVIYFLSLNIGLVTLMLGAMHLIIFYVLANWKPVSFVVAEKGE